MTRARALLTAISYNNVIHEEWQHKVSTEFHDTILLSKYETDGGKSAPDTDKNSMDKLSTGQNNIVKNDRDGESTQNNKNNEAVNGIVASVRVGDLNGQQVEDAKAKLKTNKVKGALLSIVRGGSEGTVIR